MGTSISSHSPFSLFALLRRLGEFLAALDGLLDGADHIKGRLGQVVVFALAQPLEAANGIGEIDENSGRSREYFRHVERLRQEALDLSRPRHGELVFLGE